MDYGVNTVITKRRRPNKIIICTKIVCKTFNNLLIKEILRPALTYYYNININRIKKENQIRASYPI